MITDAMGNTMIDPKSVTDSVLTMVWSLFSLFPAVIAFADGIKLVVPNQEVKMILKLNTSMENLKLTMMDILENIIGHMNLLSIFPYRRMSWRRPSCAGIM